MLALGAYYTDYFWNVFNEVLVRIEKASYVSNKEKHNGYLWFVVPSLCGKETFGGLRRFDTPRELSFLRRIDEHCFALQSNDLDGLTSSINKS